MIRVLLAIMILAISAILSNGTENGLAETITWTGGQKMDPISRNLNIRATRLAIYENYAFLAFPRLITTSIPITLARMNLEKRSDHKQYPFPNYAMQEMGNCTALQSVVDIFIDREGLLWVMDAGFWLDGRSQQLCFPKIVVFNLTTGKVVRTIDMSNFATGRLVIWHIVVDYDQQGDTSVYVSDNLNRRIVVISNFSCIHTIRVPGSKVGGKRLRDLTINLVRDNNHSSLLLINDEVQEKMYDLKLGDVQACSELQHLLHSRRLKDSIYLGNNEHSIIYYRNATYDGVIYKYDPLNSTVPGTVVQRGDRYVVPIHVVPDYTRGGMRLLESKYSSGTYTQSLKLI